jgi:hypothetical protein
MVEYSIELVPDGPRHCGGCTLCCKLLPVRELAKAAGERCKHQQTGKGCKVYAQLARVSPSCRVWNCRWLVNQAGGTARPDRARYVIDIVPDYIEGRDDATGEVTAYDVVQIWIDPKHPEAHHDPALREWLDREGLMALVRFNSADAFLLCPPSRSSSKQWVEKTASMTRRSAIQKLD